MDTIKMILRGISQIFFVENALSGLLILIALAFADVRLALLTLLGSVVQSLTAKITGIDDATAHGLMGYNGALVGAAAALFAGYSPTAVLITIVGACACIPVHQAVAALFAQTTLPVSTAPFCIVAGLTWAGLGSLVESVPLTVSAEPGLGFLYGFSNSFAEVILSDGTIVGLIILVALFLGSPVIGAFGLGGAVLGLALATGVHGGEEASSGLFSYSSVLVAIAVGAVFWTGRSWLWRICGAIMGVALTLPIQFLLGLTPIPVFTWPFLIALWVILLIPHRVPATRSSTSDEKVFAT